MPTKIKQLPDSVADQIAAGEVIERPASVVKELVENAIDADASMIEVTFLNGGIDEIEVRDDGNGIPSEDLSLAVERHATSKISDAADLKGVSTLGFRGEALASIASVADVEITTHHKDEPEAQKLIKPASGESTVKPAGRKQGTTVTVKNLFETVPARKRFLKTESTERKHIIREVQKKILAYPEVHFRLLEGEDLILSVPPGDLRSRTREVLGRDIDEHLISIDKLEPDWRNEGRFGLTGLISDGEETYHSRRRQFTFVNGRPVRAPVIYRAISKAYEKFGYDENHPVTVLFLDIPSDSVDVNVHPRKEEIRFHDSESIFRFTYESIKETLQDHYQSRAETNVEKPAFGNSTSTTDESNPPSDRVSPSGDESRLSEDADEDRDEPTDLFRQKKADAEQSEETEDERDSARVLGQFRETFLVVEREGGLFIVDQHTAHERILYETYKDQVDDREATQMLSVPITLDLDRADREVVLSRSEELEDLGLVIEEFGGNSLVVQGVPSYLGRRAEDKRMVYDMIEEFLEWDDRERLSDPADDMITIMSCRSAVMRGDRLMPREQRELLEGLNNIQFPANCPHGRRIFYEISNDEFSSWFERPKDDLCSQE